MVVALVDGKFYRPTGELVPTLPSRAEVVVLWMPPSAQISEIIVKQPSLDLRDLLTRLDLGDKQLIGFQCEDGLLAVTNIKETLLGKFVDAGMFKQLTDTFGQPYMLDAAFFRSVEEQFPKQGVFRRLFGGASWNSRRFLVVSGGLFALSVATVVIGWGLEYAAKRLAGSREEEAKAFYRGVEEDIRKKAGNIIADVNPKIYRRALGVAANLVEHEIVSVTYAKDKGLIVVVTPEDDSSGTERLSRFGRVTRDGKNYQVSIP